MTLTRCLRTLCCVKYKQMVFSPSFIFRCIQYHHAIVAMVQWHNSIKIQLVVDSINYCVIGAVLLIVSHYLNGIFHIFSHLYGERFGYVGGRPTYWIRTFRAFRMEKRVIKKTCNSRNFRDKNEGEEEEEETWHQCRFGITGVYAFFLHICFIVSAN